ncbi:MAG TPA: UDP-N-acetylmuramate dehydrogenase [Actinomycetota bacterium]
MPDLVLAERILREACGDRLRRGFPLAPLTTLRVGGPAALFLEPDDDDDLRAVSRAVTASGVAWTVIGKGSNVLVADAGFDGLVLRLGRGFRWAARDGDRLRAGAAMPLPALSGIALRHGLAGIEFGGAIPASLGGAVRMNAGAHDGEMADVVSSIRVFRIDDGASTAIPGAEAGFAYRSTALPPDALVVGAELALTRGDADAIRARMDEARAWRRRTQPLAEPNCGSVFTNPPGDHAARLIDAAGGKGLRVGGAEVSTKHANFIVTGEGATAADVAELIERVRGLVRERTGVELVPEVRTIGGSVRADA